MESKINYTLVGLTVLILTLCVIAASIWLSVGFNQKDYVHYTIYTHESVSGLTEESAVKFNGLKVGQVRKIELSHVDPKRTKILISVEKDTPITKSTYATLITQGITGTTYLGLSPGTSTFVPIEKTPGEPYPIIHTKPSFMSQLEKSIKEITKDLKQVFNKKNVANLQESLSNLQTITASFATNNSNIKQSLHDLPQVMDGLKKASQQFASIMETGKEGLEQVSQKTIPSATLLLRRLETIAANLEDVSAQMRQNPAVIIRGTKPPKPGPGE